MTENGHLLGEFFINGDVACAEGAISAGCRFFAGYPITPATEIAERMSRRLPAIGGTYIQMEDEIASMNAILGASWAGVKSMTSTSGPGFSLMMENIGLGVMLETPCVVVNIQRAGPSTGLPTLVGQQDIMQARWGSHGSYEIIALSPDSPQHMFDLTVKAFNLSEKYRVPVLMMSDEVVGHMSEKVVIPQISAADLIYRKMPQIGAGAYHPYKADESLVPPMHDERGYPAMTAAAQDKLVTRLIDKIRLHADDIIMYDEYMTDDADIVVCAYGITSRIARYAVKLARQKGIKAGFLQLITLWPFAEKRVRELASQVKTFIVPEINRGQIVYEVERCSCGKARSVSLPHSGGDVHRPETILAAIKECHA
jgi:2-oxoglutarate ferredoxin oxidoreductase subunit alpha